MPYLPVFSNINFTPVTHVATVTQSANAFSFGSLNSVAVASNVNALAVSAAAPAGRLNDAPPSFTSGLPTIEAVSVSPTSRSDTDSVPWIAAMFDGLKPAVIALVLIALQRVARSALRGPVQSAVAGDHRF